MCEPVKLRTDSFAIFVLMHVLHGRVHMCRACRAWPVSYVALFHYVSQLGCTETELWKICEVQLILTLAASAASK